MVPRKSSISPPQNRARQLLIAVYRIAGVAAADTVGIARNAQIVSVKIGAKDVATYRLAMNGYNAAIAQHQRDVAGLSESDYRGAVWLLLDIPC